MSKISIIGKKCFFFILGITTVYHGSMFYHLNYTELNVTHCITVFVKFLI